MYSKLHLGIFCKIEKGQKIYEVLKKKTKATSCVNTVLNAF